jgi:hypothetical protein
MSMRMFPGDRPLVPILVVLFLALRLAAATGEGESVAAPASAEAAASEGVLLFPILGNAQGASASEDAAAFGEELRSGLGRNLAAAGYSLVDGKDALSPVAADSPNASEGALASSLARAGGARWAAVCELSLDQGRIAYRVALYDAEDGTLVGGDAFSLLAGLSAVSFMNDSTARAVRRLALYGTLKLGMPRRLVDYRVVVLCPVEGAEVSIDSFGTKAGPSVGKIKNGRLELPYYPFLVGSTLQISAGLSGQGRMRAEAKLGRDAVAVDLKPPHPRLDLLLGTGTGRLLGAGGELRGYIDPEWSFIFFGDKIYADYDFRKGSTALAHDELRNGFGWYLFFPPSSKFRMGYAAGYDLMLSFVSASGSGNRVLSDLALIPLNLFGEFDIGRDKAIWLSIESAFSVGTGGSGLLGRQWLDDGVPAISAGMLWRRR